jgi:calcineurin-like phosphoesterase family protein
VHATDPHLYLYPGEDATDAVKQSTAFQESHDRDVMSAFFQRVGTLPQISGSPAFILITGDFGVDPCLIPNADTLKKPDKTRTLDDCVNKFDIKKRDDEVEELSELFSASPVRNIYFVAGNNDLPLETADDAGIAYFNQFFQDVQSKISTKNSDVRLHNLTGCYGPKGGAISDCSPDIPGSAYRMIGFPSYSFKNKEPGHEKNPGLQAAQFTIFRDLLDQATKDGKKVIIATHVPEIDDPYYLARDRYDGVKPEPPIDADKDNPRSAYSTWNVQKSLLDEWTKILASDSVAAVLAGHLHDGHKEIYERPYSWSTLKDYQMGFRKLFLTPPLSAKNQDGSPIQARGFSVVSLEPDRVSNRIYWYDGLTASFNPDSSVEPDFGTRRHRPPFLHRIVGSFAWLWNVNTGLDRIATFLIALLTAFLTVVALWQIPPSDDPLAKKPAGADSKDANTDSKAAGGATVSSPFTTRFGATVLAGLGGLVVAEVTKTLGSSTPSPDTKWYYIVCFIFFFFALLFSLNFLRAVAEALRSRVAVIYYPLARLGHPGRRSIGLKFFDWLSYWVSRLIRWVFSLRVPLLTFFDTFINLIQGKNQTTTQAFTDAIIEQQRNVIRVADVIRKKLNSLIESKLLEIVNEGTHPAEADKEKRPGHVRVSISVMSADQSNVHYISRSAGSALLPFPKISLAWVSVFTGKIRWYELNYQKQNIILFDNSNNTIPDAPKELPLDNYYQYRDGDYQAFVVLPVPHPQRAFGSKYVKGAIHISFSSKSDFERIWSVPPPAVPPTAAPGIEVLQAAAPAPVGPTVPPAAAPATFSLSEASDRGALPMHYPQTDHMLDDWCPDPEIRTALNDAVAVLGELLHGFNEVIYNNYIQPNQGD